MSDNLKVAKECGFYVDEAGSIYGPDGDRPITEQLEAYTSRILASQQAAHEAEIAKLNQESASLRTVERLRDEEIAWLREAHGGCLGERDDANERIAYLEGLVAMLVEFAKNCYRYDSHDCVDYFDASWQKEILANTQASAEQFIAECEQRGAVKALEDAAIRFENCGGGYELFAPSVADELRIIMAELSATSKKAG